MISHGVRPEGPALALKPTSCWMEVGEGDVCLHLAQGKKEKVGKRVLGEGVGSVRVLGMGGRG